jgi:membrane protein YdbS with pleckstrin-like domain
MTPMVKRQRIGCGIWIGVSIALIGLAGIVGPSLLGVDGMSGGYALACLGLFVLIIGLVTALVYAQRVRALRRILSGEGMLARWTYTDAQGKQQTESEYQRWAGHNRALLVIMVFWFVLIAGVLVGYDYFRTGDVNWPFAGSMLGIVILLGMVAWLAPRLQRRQAKRSSQEVIISRSGLVLSGAFHTWVAPLNRLGGVSFREGPGESVLEFRIRSASWLGSSSGAAELVRVAVPPDQQEAARQVVIELSGCV